MKNTLIRNNPHPYNVVVVGGGMAGENRYYLGSSPVRRY